MANRPYQEKVDQFLADYQDKFLPTLITGKGGGEGISKAQETTFAGMPMTKEQAQIERDKMLAASIHPDTFGKVLDVMGGRGTPGSPFTNLTGPVEALAGETAAIPVKDLYKQWQGSRGFPAPVPPPFTVGGTTSGTLDQLRVAGERKGLAEFQAAIPPDFLRGGGVVAGEKPVPGGWDWRGELAGQGTYSAGPERFFVGGREVPAGTPGAVSGDQLARDRIAREGGSAIPQEGWNVNLPGGGSYWETPEMNARTRAESGGGGFEMPGEIKTALQGIQKILMTPTARPWSPQGYLGKEGGYSKAKLSALENLAGTLEKMAATGAGYQTKMAEIGAEKPYREAMGDYYRRMAGVHEKALPGEEFAKYATGIHALSEAERPYAFPPNSAIYQGAKLLGYVPEKPEAIHPIIRDIINKSELTDPNTGMKTGGFDIRGARQKIGYLAPWLKSQGIEVPKESYKMTKGEFLAEQKAFVSRLPKKERKKYTEQYSERDWNTYWGKD